MKISYHWLHDYLPGEQPGIPLEPEKLSSILTSVGLEVESMEKYEQVKGGLEGLVVGEVMECEKHPNADKLKITKVNTGANAGLLQIVCGAHNVAKGQKVVVAAAGTTIHPLKGEPVTMRVAKIRGMESQGMICAEDEIGLGEDHAGIIVLPADAVPGSPVTGYFESYSDWIYEIGLTPNHMDAMSHYGVARDVCAWLSHHHQKEIRPKNILNADFPAQNNRLPVEVRLANAAACPRYAGVSIAGITIRESPAWMQNRLRAIGVKTINNIVDATNYILHETGQPLHAYDLEQIAGRQVNIMNLPAGTSFLTLDKKEIKLNAEDLVICDGAQHPMCIAGVFGGIDSGVKETTRDIFLESAFFAPAVIRRTSVHHHLRTEAAVHFEKGIDISNTVNVLKRAALLIAELGTGELASNIADLYPVPKEQAQVTLKYSYLKKLSGKIYEPQTVTRILSALGFTLLSDTSEAVSVQVPLSKPDISLPADLVEEIVRIDGLDNIEIPVSVTLSPSIDTSGWKEAMREKLSFSLAAQGYQEIVTNSITNSKYFTEAVLAGSVKMINSLSADLDVLRPSMLETGLEAIAYNLNRRQNNLQLFEFGKTYSTSGGSAYSEKEHLSLYITGQSNESGWRQKGAPLDFYRAKGTASALLGLCGIREIEWKNGTHCGGLNMLSGGRKIAKILPVSAEKLRQFDIAQPVCFIDIYLSVLLDRVAQERILYTEVPKFPPVQRDLALIVPKGTAYSTVEQAARGLNIPRLQGMRLFDVFAGKQLEPGKQSMGVNFTFQDEEKTLTDEETDRMVQQLITVFENELGAEIRK